MSPSTRIMAFRECKFSGTSEQTLYEFLRDFNDIARCYDILVGHKGKYLILCLRGPARDLMDELSEAELQNYHIIVSRLTTVFGGPISQEKAKREMAALRYGGNMNALSLGCAVQRLTQIAYPDDWKKRMVNYYTEKFSPEFQERLRESWTPSVLLLFTESIRIENEMKTELMTQQSSAESDVIVLDNKQDNVSETGNAEKPFVCYSCEQPGHIRRYCPKVKQPPFLGLCFGCGTRGHPRYLCPSNFPSKVARKNEE